MTRKWRMSKREKRELDGLFYQCSNCKTEHATWLRRTKTQTWAVCSVCGHEQLMVKFSESAFDRERRTSEAAE